MNKIKSLYTKHKEVILYLCFGVMTTLVDTLVFMLFDFIFSQGLSLLSTLIAWAVATVFAYFVNKVYVFESRSWQEDVVKRESFEFAITRLFCLGVSILGMFLLVTVCSFDSFGFELFGFLITGNLIAKLIMSFVVFVLNYFFGKFVVFRKAAPTSSQNADEENV